MPLRLANHKKKTIAMIPQNCKKRPQFLSSANCEKAITMNRPRKQSQPAESSREWPQTTAAYRNCNRNTTPELAKKQVQDISLSRKSKSMKLTNSRKRARQTCWLAKVTAMHTANSQKAIAMKPPVASATVMALAIHNDGKPVKKSWALNKTWQSTICWLCCPGHDKIMSVFTWVRKKLRPFF